MPDKPEAETAFNIKAAIIRADWFLCIVTSVTVLLTAPVLALARADFRSPETPQVWRKAPRNILASSFAGGSD